jgi:hypothetical protein
VGAQSRVSGRLLRALKNGDGVVAIGNAFKFALFASAKLRCEIQIALTPSNGWVNQLFGGTRKIYWWFFCVNCLPVWGQVTVLLVRSARFFGTDFSLYRARRLCLTKGPPSNATEIPIS